MGRIVKVIIVLVILLSILTKVDASDNLTYDDYISIDSEKLVTVSQYESFENIKYASCTYLTTRVESDVRAYNDLKDKYDIGLYKITNTCEDSSLVKSDFTYLYVYNDLTHLVETNNYYIYANDFIYNPQSSESILIDSNLTVYDTLGNNVTESTYNGFSYDNELKTITLNVSEEEVTVNDLSGQIVGPKLLYKTIDDDDFNYEDYYTNFNTKFKLENEISEPGIYRSKLYSVTNPNVTKDVVVLNDDYNYFTNYVDIIYRPINYIYEEDFKTTDTLKTFNIDSETYSNQDYNISIDNLKEVNYSNNVLNLTNKYDNSNQNVNDNMTLNILLTATILVAIFLVYKS